MYLGLEMRRVSSPFLAVAVAVAIVVVLLLPLLLPLMVVVGRSLV